MTGVDTFCACLEKKLGLFEKYLSATLCMEENLDLWDMKRLSAYLKERQGLIKDIDQIDRRIYRLKEASPRFMENASARTKNRVEQYMTEVKTIIEKVSSFENNCMDRFQNESERLKSELLRMRNGRQAIKGYGAKATNIPKFLDMKR